MCNGLEESCMTLNEDENRFLVAACLTSPNHWMRSQVVGERAQFTAQQTDELTSALAHAGMLETTSDGCARLTEQGRAQSSKLARLNTQTKKRSQRWWGIGRNHSIEGGAS
jgi:hypothetical protein